MFDTPVGGTLSVDGSKVALINQSGDVHISASTIGTLRIEQDAERNVLVVHIDSNCEIGHIQVKGSIYLKIAPGGGSALVNQGRNSAENVVFCASMYLYHLCGARCTEAAREDRRGAIILQLPWLNPARGFVYLDTQPQNKKATDCSVVHCIRLGVSSWLRAHFGYKNSCLPSSFPDGRRHIAKGV